MSRQQSSLALLRKLRPAKVRNAVRRRWFEHQLSRLHLREAPGLIELGTPYGGWIIPGGLIEPSWLCYSVGAGGDIGFDLELIERYSITVRAFDAVAGYVENAAEQAAGEPRFSAHHAAIATVDGPLRMQVTHDPQSRSVSSAGLYESEQFLELPGRTLPSLMAELGDDHIDLLKLDIEGGEYEPMPTISLRDLGVKVFAVQLHHTGSVQEARALIARLREEGYEPVACRSAVKIAFADRDLL
jgi:FkbM family methyltransferase